MELPVFVLASPTSMKILEIYPFGSTVKRQDIENAYILLSQSTKRQKKFGKGRHSKYKSIPATRKTRGANLYKTLVKLGVWQITPLHKDSTFTK